MADTDIKTKKKTKNTKNKAKAGKAKAADAQKKKAEAAEARAARAREKKAGAAEAKAAKAREKKARAAEAKAAKAREQKIRAAKAKKAKNQKVRAADAKAAKAQEKKARAAEERAMKAQAKKAKKAKGRKKLKIVHPFRTFVSVYVVLLVLLVAVLYFIPWISDNFAEVMTVEYGQLNQSKDATVYFVKDETVYYANADGRVNYHYNEGDNVRRGQTLFEIDSSIGVIDDLDYAPYDDRVSSIFAGSNLIGVSKEKDRETVLDNLRSMLDGEENQINLIKINLAISEVESLSKVATNRGINIKNSDTGVTDSYIADTSGVVSYELDGYEAELNQYTISLLQKDKLDEMPLDSLNVFNGACTVGEPICKVVNDREWYGVIWIGPNGLGKYQEGGKVTLTMKKGDQFKGKVERIYERDDNSYLVIMKFSSYYKDIATLRKAKAKITTSDETGLIVKNSFITQEDGQIGVYVLDVAGKMTFTPINVKTTDGEYSLVSSGSFTDADGEMISTLEVYDQIKKVK